MDSLARVLMISDTHDQWPYTPQNPAPKVDILLHCGNLTRGGNLSCFKSAMEDIKAVDAELKLIIAGRNDVDLDEEWVRRNAHWIDLEEQMDSSRRCIEYMHSLKDHGIHYLEEGTHRFTLASGKTFSVYASPYTPDTLGYAFGYGKEDRFNEGRRSIPPGVDIVMTHGPPSFPDVPFPYRLASFPDVSFPYRLDVNENGEHLGCKKLLSAIERARPRLHVFGHVQGGRGSTWVQWPSPPGFHWCDRVRDFVPRYQAHTFLVNAAVTGEDDKGMVVDVPLETAYTGAAAT